MLAVVTAPDSPAGALGITHLRLRTVGKGFTIPEQHLAALTRLARSWDSERGSPSPGSSERDAASVSPSQRNP